MWIIKWICFFLAYRRGGFWMGVLAYFMASFILDYFFPRRRNPFIHVEFHTFDDSQYRSSRTYSSPPPPRPDRLAEAYAILGLTPQATSDEVRQAYRRLARENHPDRFATQGEAARQQAEARFKRITEARDYILGK